MVSFTDEELSLCDLPKGTHKANGKIKILTQVCLILKPLIPKLGNSQSVGSRPAAPASPETMLEMQILPRRVWLSCLSMAPCTERSQVRFPVRHIPSFQVWSCRGACGRQPIYVSFTLFPFFLSL